MTRTATRMYGNLLLAAALGASLLSFPRAGHAEKDAQPSAQARAMTAAELHTLYGDKSWQWPDGAAGWKPKIDDLQRSPAPEKNPAGRTAAGA